jgi:hypothetical protein
MGVIHEDEKHLLGFTRVCGILRYLICVVLFEIMFHWCCFIYLDCDLVCAVSSYIFYIMSWGAFNIVAARLSYVENSY